LRPHAGTAAGDCDAHAGTAAGDHDAARALTARLLLQLRA
jgi:hypothetical protein